MYAEKSGSEVASETQARTPNSESLTPNYNFNPECQTVVTTISRSV